MDTWKRRIEGDVCVVSGVCWSIDLFLISQGFISHMIKCVSVVHLECFRFNVDIVRTKISSLC